MSAILRRGGFAALLVACLALTACDDADSSASGEDVDAATGEGDGGGGDDAARPDEGVPAPDMGPPPADMAVPRPDMATPDMAVPDQGAPDMALPDMGAPDMGAPDMAPPDADAPDADAPDIGAADMDVPPPDMDPAADVPVPPLDAAVEPDMGGGELACPADDAHEEDDTADVAGPLPEGGAFDGILCGEDQDYFIVPARAGCTLTARATFEHDQGDVDLFVIDLAAERFEVSDGTGDEESLALLVPADGDFAVGVALFEGGSNTYHLEVGLECPPPLACPGDDALEENDDAGSATELPPGAAIDALLCGADEDWFAFELDEACDVAVALTFGAAAGEAALAVLDVEGVTVAEPVPAAGRADVETTLPAGTYHVRVTAAGPPGEAGLRYGLRLGTACGAAALCPEDDAREDDDSAEEAVAAAPGAAVEGVLCGDDEDWIAIEVGDGCAVSADVRFTHDAGDIDIELIDPAGEVVGLSNGSDDFEHLEARPQFPGVHFLRVHLFEGGANTYTASYSLDCPSACPGDDPLEENDDRRTATPLTPAGAEGLICGDDVDYFTIETQAGCEVRASLAVAAGELDLLLLDANTVELARGAAAEGGLALTHTTEAGGALYFVVDAPADGDGRYALTVAQTCASELTCPGDDRFEENDGPDEAAALVAGEQVEGILCGDDLDFFTVDAAAGCTIRAAAAFNHADGDIDMALADADGVPLGISDGVSDGESIVARAEADGTYSVVLLLVDGEANTYDFALDVECAPPSSCEDDDDREDDDTRAAASAIAPGETADGVVCGADPDFFRVELEAGCVLSVDLEFVNENGDLGLALLDAGGLPIAASDGRADGESLDFRVPAAGPYFLAVALTGEGRNTYRLAVAADCAPPPVCEDDAREDDDDEASATPVGAEPIEGVVCGADQDWFALDVEAGCAVRARLEFTDADGDLDLFLADAAGDEIARSATAADVEAIAHRVAEAGTYLLVVDLFDNGGRNTYTLTADVDCEPPPVCEDDAREDDDGADTATPLAPDTTTDGVLCGRDEDWFAIDAAAGCTLRVDAEFVDARGDVDLRMFDAAGDLVGESRGIGDRETISYLAAAAGTVYVQVTLIGERNTYRLSVSQSCSACPADDALEPNDGIGQATQLELPASVDAVICSNDPDLFAIPAGEGCTIAADLRFRHADGDLNLRLFTAAGIQVAFANSRDDDENLRYAVLADGTYFARVEGVGPAQNAYNLRLAVTCVAPLCPADDANEQDDVPEDATPLVRGGPPVSGVLCDTDPDWYAVDVRAGCSLRTDVRFEHAEGDIDMEVVDADGVRYAAGIGHADDESIYVAIQQTGTYYVHVYLASGEGANQYRVTASTDCPPGRLVINEVDYDQTGGDTREFVEIHNTGPGDVPLADLRLWLADGGRGFFRVYNNLDLSPAGAFIPGGGYLVVGNRAVIDALPVGVLGLVVPDSSIQNGVDDGVVLVRGRGNNAVVLDSVSYEGELESVTEGDLGAPTALGDPSTGRCGNANDTNDNAADFRSMPPSPGTDNVCPAAP